MSLVAAGEGAASSSYEHQPAATDAEAVSQQILEEYEAIKNEPLTQEELDGGGFSGLSLGAQVCKPQCGMWIGGQFYSSKEFKREFVLHKYLYPKQVREGKVLGFGGTVWFNSRQMLERADK